jgi:hypothetical protein
MEPVSIISILLGILGFHVVVKPILVMSAILLIRIEVMSANLPNP